jgi:phospholipid transport system substrate-binding protein
MDTIQPHHHWVNNMRKRSSKTVIIGIFSVLLCSMPVSETLAEVLQVPQRVIADISETLQKKLQDKAFTQDFAQVTRFVNDVIEPHTDFDKIAPLVLGKHWKVATQTEQARFKKEFQTLLVRAYSRAFVEYSDWTIQYLPLELTKGASKVTVKTKVLQRSIQPVEVNYRMFLANGEWKVYDIVIDGVSLVTNYRSSFGEDIQRKGSLTTVIDDLASRNIEALSARQLK